MSSHKDFAVVPETVTGVDPSHPARSGARILDAEAGLVERKRDKLAICGYATSTRDLAPFRDETYEIVGLNQLYRFIERADFWADLHINWDEENVEGTDHAGWIRECGIPVLMTTRHDDLPTSVRFPVERVIADGCDYLTSTVALLIGWGIHQGYSEIALFGIDLVVGTEYEAQKACAEFWLGVAHGRGITVRIPPQSALLKHSHRYGYEREPESRLYRLSDVDRRKAGLAEQRDGTLTKMRAFDGAISEVRRILAADGAPEDLAARLKWLEETRHETMMQVATLDGALQEATFVRELMGLRARGADVLMS